MKHRVTALAMLVPTIGAFAFATVYLGVIAADGSASLWSSPMAVASIAVVLVGTATAVRFLTTIVGSPTPPEPRTRSIYRWASVTAWTGAFFLSTTLVVVIP